MTPSLFLHHSCYCPHDAGHPPTTMNAAMYRCASGDVAEIVWSAINNEGKVGAGESVSLLYHGRSVADIQR